MLKFIPETNDEEEFYGPGFGTEIELPLRRTLVQKNSFELLAASYELLYNAILFES